MLVSAHILVKGFLKLTTVRDALAVVCIYTIRAPDHGGALSPVYHAARGQREVGQLREGQR